MDTGSITISTLTKWRFVSLCRDALPPSFPALPCPAQLISVESGCAQLDVLSMPHPCLKWSLEWVCEICLNRGTKQSAGAQLQH